MATIIIPPTTIQSGITILGPVVVVANGWNRVTVDLDSANLINFPFLLRVEQSIDGVNWTSVLGYERTDVFPRITISITLSVPFVGSQMRLWRNNQVAWNTAGGSVITELI